MCSNDAWTSSALYTTPDISRESLPETHWRSRSKLVKCTGVIGLSFWWNQLVSTASRSWHQLMLSGDAIKFMLSSWYYQADTIMLSRGYYHMIWQMLDDGINWVDAYKHRHWILQWKSTGDSLVKIHTEKWPDIRVSRSKIVIWFPLTCKITLKAIHLHCPWFFSSSSSADN